MSIKSKWSKIVKMLGIPKLLLVMAAGAVLIFLSAGDIFVRTTEKAENESAAADDKNMKKEDSTEESHEYVKGLEKQLSSTLSCVNGVGKNRVMITMETTSEKVTLKDSPHSSESTVETDSTGGTRNQNSSNTEETTIFEEDGNQRIPYIVKEIEPVVKGVVIVAEGGESALVKKEIIEAVQVLFGIEAHKIKVMKLEY